MDREPPGPGSVSELVIGLGGPMPYLAAILATIPLTRSAFWGPMALTILGGLFVATLPTVLFLPALHAQRFRRALDRGSTSSPRPSKSP